MVVKATLSREMQGSHDRPKNRRKRREIQESRNRSKKCKKSYREILGIAHLIEGQLRLSESLLIFCLFKVGIFFSDPFYPRFLFLASRTLLLLFYSII